MYYKLLNKLVVPAIDVTDWGEWLQHHYEDRIIKQEVIKGILVSTVFIGLDHRIPITGNEPPLVFETMIFPNFHSTKKYKMIESYCTRCSTWDEAIEMHNTAMDYVKAELKT